MRIAYPLMFSVFMTLACTTFVASAQGAEQPASVDSDQAVQLLRAFSDRFATVAKAVEPSVVSVLTEQAATAQAPMPHPFFDDPFWRRFFGDDVPAPGQRGQPRIRPRNLGSGFIVSEDGYILTNNHVVADAAKVTVVLTDGREMEGKVVGTDPKSDVAVLKVEAQNLVPVKIGDSDRLRAGDWVLAVGSPFGLQQTVTFGIVSAVGRANIGITGRGGYEDFIQTDAAINPGNSGGPLLNLDGEVVGINTAIFSGSGGYQGIGFAIPINMAQSIRKDLVEKGKVDRGFLGVQIQTLDQELAQQFNLEQIAGALVTRVDEGTPAQRAGLKNGDVIVRWNGQDVRDSAHLRNLVAATDPGEEVEAVIQREGKSKNLRITVGSWDSSPQAQGERIVDKLGLTAQDMTDELAGKYGYEPGTQAVMVTEVELNGPAAQKGLQTGNLILGVNQREISTVKELEEQLRQVSPGENVLLYVQDGRNWRWVTVQTKPQ